MAKTVGEPEGPFSGRLWSLGFGLSVCLLSACGGDSAPSTPSDPNVADRAALLSFVGSDLILPLYEDFAVETNALRESTAAYAAAVTGTSADARLESARTAWRSAMARWQQAEVLQIGPAGIESRVGGQNLRDNIYSWPTVSSCRVDQEVIAEDFRSADFFSQKLVNVFGLDALEYLLFNESLDNTCPPQVEINQGAWSALDPAEIRKRRADYAAVLAEHLADQAEALRSQWDPSSGAFAQQLAEAGSSGSPYSSAQAALDDLFAGLFYVELRVKDEKLAVPSGLSAECSAETCPDALESPWAGHARENVLANLQAFRSVWLGGDSPDPLGPGFARFLVNLGAADLANEMSTDLESALAATEAIPDDFESSLTRGPDELRSLHAELKSLTDNLRSRFVTVLNLRIPQEGAGDND